MALWLDLPLSHFRTTHFRSPRRRPPATASASASPLWFGTSSHSLHSQETLAAPAADPRLVIAGGHRLSGHVLISGSKNAALAVLAGTLCCSAGASVVRGVPVGLSDVQAMLDILRSLGARVQVTGDGGEEGQVVVEAGEVAGPPPPEPCPESVRRTRAGFFAVGPLVGRFGVAEVALPGGCQIGSRPVDIYIDGLRALGAVVELRQGKLLAHAANGRGLVGGRFHLHFPSVGASKTLMMAAVLAEGVTVLSNVAMEPEVVDLANFLIAGGAQIEGAGTGRLVVHGRKQLHGAAHTVIPDRIEAGTLMAAAAITRSCVSMSPVVPLHLASTIEKLSSAGCRIRQTHDGVLEVSAVSEAVGGGRLRGFNIKTAPFPGFPTDLQPQFMSLLTTCDGASVVEECIFERRMRHAEELQKLGARIAVSGRTAVVMGKKRGSGLVGARVTATDLRSGASLVLAGLAAEGLTEVTGVSHVDRGYENLEGKLRQIGADITRTADVVGTGLGF